MMGEEEKTIICDGSSINEIKAEADKMISRILGFGRDKPIENTLGSTRYKKPVSYLKHDIYEYDISKANISVLRSMDVINEHEYNRLKSLDRDDRQVSVGRMQEYDRVLRVAIQEAFTRSRVKFIEDNEYTLDDLLIINTDAMFTLRQAKTTMVNNDIWFTLKNQYQLYIHCLGIDIFFSHSGGVDTIDIKGIKDEKLPLHSMYLRQLCNILGMVMDRNVEGAITEWVEFSKQYSELQLPIEYYREFNSSSKYRYLNGFGSDCPPTTQDMTDGRQYLNISYNENWNQKFYSILSQMYFNHL